VFTLEVRLVFSKVVSSVHLHSKLNKELTFEKFCARLPLDAAREKQPP
jgi:hypothetical protein